MKTRFAPALCSWAAPWRVGGPTHALLKCRFRCTVTNITTVLYGAHLIPDDPTCAPMTESFVCSICTLCQRGSGSCARVKAKFALTRGRACYHYCHVLEKLDPHLLYSTIITGFRPLAWPRGQPLCSDLPCQFAVHRYWPPLALGSSLQ